MMLKLRLPYFVYLMRRTDSLEKTLMLGEIDQEEKGAVTPQETGPDFP